MAGRGPPMIGVLDPDDLLDGRLPPGTVELTEPPFGESPVPKSVLVVGESGLLAAVDHEIEGPFLPVGLEDGPPSVPLGSLDAALESLAEGRLKTVEYPTIQVESPHGSDRALMDVTAVTAEPARISEYRAAKADGTVIDQVRADGLVVSGPAGTPGYGTAAGAPHLDPAVRGLSVVPIAPFRTARPRWVVAPPIEIEVARRETPVSLVVDDTQVGRLPAHEPVTLDWGKNAAIAVVESSEERF